MELPAIRSLGRAVDLGNTNIIYKIWSRIKPVCAPIKA